MLVEVLVHVECWGRPAEATRAIQLVEGGLWRVRLKSNTRAVFLWPICPGGTTDGATRTDSGDTKDERQEEGYDSDGIAPEKIRRATPSVHRDGHRGGCLLRG